jgi:hypothetical protein
MIRSHEGGEEARREEACRKTKQMVATTARSEIHEMASSHRGFLLLFSSSASQACPFALVAGLVVNLTPWPSSLQRPLGLGAVFLLSCRPCLCTW